MSRRTLVLFVLAVLVVCGILLARSCGEAAQPITTDNAATSPASGDRSDPGQAAADARASARSQQRDEAMTNAVSTLHRYFAALPGTDRDKADAFWAGKRPPTATGEADLRSLKNLQALRIENGTPKPLDSEAVPNAFEIPVELRASLQGQPPRHYRGWYRMRRAVADGGWEITSASVDAEVR